MLGVASASVDLHSASGNVTRRKIYLKKRSRKFRSRARRLADGDVDAALFENRFERYLGRMRKRIGRGDCALPTPNTSSTGYSSSSSSSNSSSSDDCTSAKSAEYMKAWDKCRLEAALRESRTTAIAIVSPAASLARASEETRARAVPSPSEQSLQQFRIPAYPPYDCPEQRMSAAADSRSPRGMKLTIRNNLDFNLLPDYPTKPQRQQSDPEDGLWTQTGVVDSALPAGPRVALDFAVECGPTVEMPPDYRCNNPLSVAAYLSDSPKTSPSRCGMSPEYWSLHSGRASLWTTPKASSKLRASSSGISSPSLAESSPGSAASSSPLCGYPIAENSADEEDVSLAQQPKQGSKEYRRGRPRADELPNLIQKGSKSPSSLKCRVCNRVFPRGKSLQAHERTHSGIKPFQCDYPGCTKSFAQTGQLNTHKRLHTGEKPFMCSVPGCEIRYTHANRHCSNHPNATLIRSPNPVLQQISDNLSPEVIAWLEKEKAKALKTPSKRRRSVKAKTSPEIKAEQENVFGVGERLYDDGQNEDRQGQDESYGKRKRRMKSRKILEMGSSAEPKQISSDDECDATLRFNDNNNESQGSQDESQEDEASSVLQSEDERLLITPVRRYHDESHDDSQDEASSVLQSEDEQLIAASSAVASHQQRVLVTPVRRYQSSSQDESHDEASPLLQMKQISEEQLEIASSTGCGGSRYNLPKTPVSRPSEHKLPLKKRNFFDHGQARAQSVNQPLAKPIRWDSSVDSNYSVQMPDDMHTSSQWSLRAQQVSCFVGLSETNYVDNGTEVTSTTGQSVYQISSPVLQTGNEYRASVLRHVGKSSCAPMPSSMGKDQVERSDVIELEIQQRDEQLSDEEKKWKSEEEFMALTLLDLASGLEYKSKENAGLAIQIA